MCFIFTRFFMIGYLAIGFEFAAELTYPIPEGISSGVLMVASEIFGIAFIAGGGELLDNFGDMSANLTFLGLLVVGLVITTQIDGTDLRRQAVTTGLENQTTCNDISVLKPSMTQNQSLCLTTHSIFPS
jgi:FLVCR family feline leukemia virus subgroup C receptor-related protein